MHGWWRVFLTNSNLSNPRSEAAVHAIHVLPLSRFHAQRFSCESNKLVCVGDRTTPHARHHVVRQCEHEITGACDQSRRRLFIHSGNRAIRSGLAHVQNVRSVGRTRLRPHVSKCEISNLAEAHFLRRSLPCRAFWRGFGNGAAAVHVRLGAALVRGFPFL